MTQICQGVEWADQPVDSKSMAHQQIAWARLRFYSTRTSMTQTVMDLCQYSMGLA